MPGAHPPPTLSFTNVMLPQDAGNAGSPRSWRRKLQPAPASTAMHEPPTRIDDPPSLPRPSETSPSSESGESVPSPSLRRRRAPRGLAAVTPARRREIARMGGRAAHRAGTAHEFTPEEARTAGHKGGSAPRRPKAHVMVPDVPEGGSQVASPGASEVRRTRFGGSVRG